MKLSLKITGLLLIFVLLTPCIAATENKDLPTKEEITDFIAGIPVSDNYIITVFNTVQDKHPTWNCDIWEDKNGNQLLSLYYVDPDSAKGYGSIYFNELGEEISIREVEIVPVLIRSYVGKAASEENTPVDTTNGSTEEQSPEEEAQPVEENTQSVGDERLAEYEERLAEYEKRLDEYEEDQSVKYDPSSVEDVTKTVDDVAHTVEDESQSVQAEYELVEYKEQTVVDSPKKVTGQLIFDPSEKMKVGKTENVDVYITTDVTKNISEEYGINERLQSRNINVTPRMKVTLVGGETGAFYIETIPPNSDGVQPVIGNNTTIWSWQVTPLKSGKQTLLLSIEYVIPLNNGDDQHYKTLKNMEEQIYVEISPYYFVECNWQWIIGIIIVPVLLAKYTSRKDQNKSNFQPPKKVD